MRRSRWSPALVLILLTACGGGSAELTDAQRVWCLDHDLENDGTGNYGDSAVVIAAQRLDISIPESVETTEILQEFERGGSSRTASDIPPNYMADLEQWRTTGDYARACVAAYEGR